MSNTLKLEYIIREEDFFNHQLYVASKSAAIQNRKKRSWLFLTLGFALVGCYFLGAGDRTFGIIMILYALFIFICYPFYFKWRFKRHYKKFIKNNYYKRFNELISLDMDEENFHVSGKDSETTSKVSSIECVHETSSQFYLQLNNGMYYIIPKRSIKNIEEVKEQFKQYGLRIKDELTWKW